MNHDEAHASHPEVGLPVKLFMDSETGSISEVQLMLPHTEELVCDCGESSPEAVCVHIELTSLYLESTDGRLMLIVDDEDDDIDLLGPVLDLTDPEQVSLFRRIILKRTQIEVV